MAKTVRRADAQVQIGVNMETAFLRPSLQPNYSENRPFIFPPPGAKLLQDYQAAHGPKEGEEEAAGAELPVLQVHPGVCVRHAPGLQKLRQVQRGEEHES